VSIKEELFEVQYDDEAFTELVEEERKKKELKDEK